MALGGEVDDVAAGSAAVAVPDEHPADVHVVVVTGALVRGEVGGEGLLELQCHALAHHTHGVDRVHQGVDVGVEEVPLSELDHHHLPSGSPVLPTVEVPPWSDKNLL